ASTTVSSSRRAMRDLLAPPCALPGSGSRSHCCNYRCGIARRDRGRFPEPHRPVPGGGNSVQIPINADPEDRSWQDYANCLGVDPDLFFPERGASTREAKEVCRGCVVREECLEFALEN